MQYALGTVSDIPTTTFGSIAGFQRSLEVIEWTFRPLKDHIAGRPGLHERCRARREPGLPAVPEPGQDLNSVHHDNRSLPAWIIGHHGKACRRSEEHTSELQSLMRISYAVFCLKKKINTTPYYTRHSQKSTEE